LITLPVSIPANLVTSIYIQLRMIAAIASISGKELGDDKIKTLCILCLTGNNSAEILKQAGIKIAEKYTAGLIQKYITRDIIIYINKAVGFRLITKAGSTGILNLTKAVPIVGGLVGATFDGITTNIIGNTARDLFLEKKSTLVETK
ncbi:EcsC family protein, partial [Snodgrassella alvi]